MGEEMDTVDTAETTALQRRDDDGRDQRGRFSKGNRHGWQRGQTGNSKGRRDAMTDTLRRKLDERHDDHGRSKRDAIIDTLIDEALDGSIRAIELLFTRLEGRMPTISSATVDIHVSRSEFFQYEAKVTELQDIAERRGTPISRSKAVQLLAASDPRILMVMAEGEDDE
jgi:hypothetical protein